MKTRSFWFSMLVPSVATAFLLVAETTSASPPPATQGTALYKPDHGPWTVTVRDENWMDTKRNRAVPVRIYLPAKSDDQTPRPVIIESHGWGGSRTTYRYFNEYLAGWGYLVIAPTHAGSDTASVALRPQPATPSATSPNGGPKRETLMQSINDPDNLRDRPKDVSFVIDEISRQQDLAKIADLSHIGVAGHSFGAYTAMAIGGMLVDLPEGKKQSLRDPRVKAVLPMSPEGPGTMGITAGAWDQFSAPVLFLTGTKDYGITPRAATWRDDAFKAIHTVPEWIVTIVDATHMTFARPADDAPLIQSVGIAFFDAKVLGDPNASAWMNDFFAAKHTDCIVDHKD